MSFDVAGTTQPQSRLQLVVGIADYGYNPHAACVGPRLHWIHGMQVNLQGVFPPANFDELSRHDHDVSWSKSHSHFGSCQAIRRLPDGHRGARDPRRDGQTSAIQCHNCSFKRARAALTPKRACRQRESLLTRQLQMPSVLTVEHRVGRVLARRF
jgi:hypothetical protein